MRLARVLLAAAAAVAVFPHGADASTSSGVKRELTWEVFQALWEAYPKEESGTELKKRMGKQVDNPAFVNTCAIRMSDAWNKVAKQLPALWPALQKREPFTKVLGWHEARLLTREDSEGNAVAIRARELHDVLHTSVGPAPISTWEEISKEHANAGIVVFYGCTFEGNKSGNHIDLWQGGVCRGACYNDPQFKCKYKFFPVAGANPADGSCTADGLTGSCMDQLKCVEESGGAKWPAFVPDQCGGDGRAPNIKCCVTKAE